MNAITRRMMLKMSSLALVPPGVRTWMQTRSAPNIADSEWHHYANDPGSSRYVPFDQINADNFNNLEVAWRFKVADLGSGPDFLNQSTPILAKGRVFFTGGARRGVAAVDAATGKLLWSHQEDEGDRRGARGGSGHGVSYWTDGVNERILYVTVGYQLVSLDAKTGNPDPKFGKNGVVELREEDDQEMDLKTADIGLHSTAMVVNNVVVVGAAHSPGGVPRSRGGPIGYTRGYDVKTGKRLWIFHTIPQKGEFGYDTWIEPGQAEGNSHTGVWAEMSADPELGLVYIGVELPAGDAVGIYRKGNSLFSETIVALDVQTGKRKWHFQMVHHGLWDHDVPCASILCDIPVNGRTVKALAQPTKQSFLYVLNRETGQPIWPIEERPVASGDVPGEWYSPTQPFPTKPPAFDRQGVLENDLVDFTPEIKARALEVASHYRMGPLFTPPAWNKPEGPWGTLTMPSFQGGANWPGGSYDPETHMVYIYSKSVMDVSGIGPNTNESSDFKVIQSLFSETPGTADVGVGGPPPGEEGGAGGRGGGGRGGGARGTDPDNSLTAPIVPGRLTVAGLPLNKPPYGRITAIDLTKGDIAWQVAHGETPDAIKNHPLLKGIKIPRTGQSGILGVLTTKTLVICADGGLFTDDSGRKGARLRAYDKKTGEEKGAVFMPARQTGAPMSYMKDGRQYIVLTIASSNYGAEVVAFRLA
jgi:quinoprotein glucose dehydrogenase